MQKIKAIANIADNNLFCKTVIEKPDLINFLKYALEKVWSNVWSTI